MIPSLNSHFFWLETLRVRWTEKVLESLPLPVFVMGAVGVYEIIQEACVECEKEWCGMRSKELLCWKDRRIGSHIETEKDGCWGHEWCLGSHGLRQPQ